MNIKKIRKSLLVLIVFCVIWAVGQEGLQAAKAANTAGSTVPLGTIVAYAGTKDIRFNDGSIWMICDGRTISRTGYSTLFTIIGDTFGEGDRINTFNLPDLRGRFLRGTDKTDAGDAKRDLDSATRTAMNSGGNTGNLVGSVQEDDFKSHSHKLYKHHRSYKGEDPGDKPFDDGTDVESSTHPAGGKETRPKNAYVNFLIRVK